MRLSHEIFGKRVRAKYTIGERVHGEGVVIGYVEGPTIEIQREDGSRFNWVAELVEEDTRPGDFEPLLGPLYD